jgi:hypothetical protein
MQKKTEKDIGAPNIPTSHNSTREKTLPPKILNKNNMKHTNTTKFSLYLAHQLFNVPNFDLSPMLDKFGTPIFKYI